MAATRDSRGSVRGLVLATLALLIAACTPPPTPDAVSPAVPTTVFLVRHAEKLLEGEDPALSEEGRVRAEALAHALTDAGIEVIYSTEFARCLDTARPVAEVAGVEVREFPVAPHGTVNDFLKAQAREILERQAGRTVLVVGHSNTTPGVARALGARDVPDLTEADYDDLFQVVIAPDGTARWIHLHYGARTP